MPYVFVDCCIQECTDADHPYCLLCVACSSEASCSFHHPVWYRALSLRMRALCANSTFRHHPHPIGYLCAGFRFYRALPPPLSQPAVKNRTFNHSSHSPSLFDAANRSFCFGILLNLFDLLSKYLTRPYIRIRTKKHYTGLLFCCATYFTKVLKISKPTCLLQKQMCINRQ